MARRRGGIVRIFEEDEFEVPACDRWYLGTFGASHDTGGKRFHEASGLSVDEALAWGLERTDAVYIRYGNSHYFSAGTVIAEDAPPWPPPDLPPLERRRAPGEEWKDRTDADPPIAWTVRISLRPEDWSLPERGRWDATIAEMAGASGADGWDAEDLEAFRAETEREEREAGPGEEYGLYTSQSPSYRIRLTVHAPTQALADEQARRRVTAPEGWVLEVRARPA